MKHFSFMISVGVAMLLSAYTIKTSINWRIVDGYSINFKGTDAEGVFKTMKAEISFDENDLSGSKTSIMVDVASINTGNGIKNKHAKSDKWLDAKKYPSIIFNSTKFIKTTEGYQVEGVLEMHGIKKQMTIPFTFVSNTFKANFRVNRMDFGIGTMDGLSKKVSNEIKLEISIPVTKK